MLLNPTERYAFIVESWDPATHLFRRYRLVYHPSQRGDPEIEMVPGRSGAI